MSKVWKRALKITASDAGAGLFQGPRLLTGINFKSSMNK